MEAPLAYFKILSQNLPQGTEQNNKISAKSPSLWAEIQNMVTPNLGQKWYT
jgi:hypothetical protein